jgi:hypothetical protein
MGNACLRRQHPNPVHNTNDLDNRLDISISIIYADLRALLYNMKKGNSIELDLDALKISLNSDIISAYITEMLQPNYDNQSIDAIFVQDDSNTGAQSRQKIVEHLIKNIEAEFIERDCERAFKVIHIQFDI